MYREKKLTGSLGAKIVAYFVMAISAIVCVGALMAVLVILESEGYNYQSQAKCVEVIAREMMVDYAWDDMQDISYIYEEQGTKGLEEYDWYRNYTIRIYKAEKLVWTNYSGAETPYSFRYNYNRWIETAKLQHTSEEYNVYLYVTPDFPYDDEYASVYNRAVLLGEGMYIYPVVIGVCLFIMLTCFIFLMCGAGHRNGREGITPGVLTSLHFDIVAFVFAMVAFMGLLLCVTMLGSVGGEWRIFWMVVAALVTGAEAVWCTLFCADFAVRLKLGKWWRNTLIAATFRLIKRIVGFGVRSIVKLIKGVPLIINVLLVFAGLCLLEFMGLCTYRYRDSLVALWFMEKIVLLPIVMYVALVCKKLQEGSAALAEGNLNYKTDTSKMFLDFKEHGENLNQIGEGISKAVAERMKSEHLKTELITNVSHDLKTPLTSIINYAELLNYEVQKNAQEEKIAEYAEVLHRQSKRLKKLLEDLVEASKATTGALEVNLEPCEISVLLSQAVGEYEQKFAEKQLNLIVRQPEEPVKIMADGRHLWRVFDNLLNNICKYAQEDSRVYLSVQHKEGQVEIIFRNMSKYALDISAEELEERFVRGDKSRHMEGNGLGLSIAKSLVELQHGSMKIVTDGDLFKVTLYFQEI